MRTVELLDSNHPSNLNKAVKSALAAVTGVRARSARRLGWGIADQGASSITNFAVVALVAHSLDAEQFGAFSLAYLTYGFVLPVVRGVTSYPLQTRFSNAELPVLRRAVTDFTGAAIVCGLAAGAIVLAVAAMIGGATGGALEALGLTLPGLMLQDCWRYAFFVQGRGSQAFLNDSIWAVTQIPGLLLLHASGTRSVFWFVLVWGGAALVAAVIGPFQAKVFPRPIRALDWWKKTSDIGIRFALSNFVSNGAGQLRSSIVAGFLGLAAIGYVQASGTLMGPFMVVYYGIGLVTVPEAVRRLHRGEAKRILPFCLMVSVSLALAALAWGMFLFVALPHGLGRIALGGVWKGTYPLVLAQTLAVIGACLSAGAGTGIGALGAARQDLRSAIIASIATIACGVIGPLTGGAMGTVLGIAVANWFGAAVLWWQLRAAVQLYDANREETRTGRRSGRHRRTRYLRPELDHPSAQVSRGG